MTHISLHPATGWANLQRQLSGWALGLMLALGITQGSWAQAPAAVAVGQALPNLSLKDQFDKPWLITPATRLVMFAAGRKASNLVQGVLQALPKDELTRKNAVYLADMSKMPGFISSPLLGSNGNQEYLLWLSRTVGGNPTEWSQAVADLL